MNRQLGPVLAFERGLLPADTLRKFAFEPHAPAAPAAPHDRLAREGQGGDLPSETNHPRGLRTYLRRAGVKRAELHATADRSRKAITFDDCRAPGITWRAVRGDGPLKIKSAARQRDTSVGPSRCAMVSGAVFQRYRRRSPM